MALSSLYKGILYCVLGAVTWGVNGTVSQYLFTHYVVDSAWITALRMIAAGVVLLVLFFPKQRNAFYGMFHDPASLRNLLLLSIFGLLLCQYSYLTAIKYSNSATATVLQTLNVVLMSFFLAVRFRRRPSARELVSVALAVLGVFLVATNGNPSTMVLSPQGLTWGLIGAAGCVAYPTLSQGLAIQWGAVPVNAAGMIIGGSALCLGVQAWGMTPELDAVGWLTVAFIILVGTALSFTLFVQGIRLVGPMKSTLIGTLEPVTAAVVSAAWLGTAFHPVELAGFVCILATVFLIVVQWPSR